MSASKNTLLRELPNVHESIQFLSALESLKGIPLKRLKFCTRLYLNELRQTLLADQDTVKKLSDKKGILDALALFIQRYHRPHFKKVINGTGIIVHTNLGRSPLPESVLDWLHVLTEGYCNLELDLETGKRGSRYQHVESLLCELTGAESGLIVNNNAAAVFLTLNTLAKDKEVIVSRGQLVEIGGSFRIPDIMDRSGAKLVEIGTTNRTHYHDYQQAITPETALLLRVHCSNYRIIGFTSDVPARELAQLGKAHNIPVMEDLGSGCLIDLSRYGLAKEPIVQEIVASGVDIVTFSGDKLLGGPQAGIIIGKKPLIDQIKKNPLNRMLRIDKLTLAALEAVLRLYLDEGRVFEELPTLEMIATPEGSVRARAEYFVETYTAQLQDHCHFDILSTFSQVGGGAVPEQNLPSWAVTVQPINLRISQLEERLRHTAVPVLTRIETGELLIDMRTVADEEMPALAASLHSALLLKP
ncbi:MAG: L-seryl-tRNA(Sec) selenium transferase [Desulfobulbus sp.]|nr:L-seryl-tRNA(Sec) selenium transferase [Desulfobulbus sp.]